MIFEGERIVVRDGSTGTQAGRSLHRPPSGARVRVDEISIVRIAAQWCLDDAPAYFKQLGGAGG